MQQNQKDPTTLLINGLHSQQLLFPLCHFLLQRQGKKFLGRESTPRETHRCNFSLLRAILKMLISYIARSDPNHRDKSDFLQYCVFFLFFFLFPATASRCKMCFCLTFSFNHLKAPQSVCSPQNVSRVKTPMCLNCRLDAFTGRVSYI